MATQYAFIKIVTDGLVLTLDAADRNSYPSSGTTWTDLSINRNTGTLTNSTFESTNGGGIIFNGTTTTLTTTLSITPNDSTNAIWFKWNGTNQAKAITYIGAAGSTGMGFYINDGTNSATAGNKISILYGGVAFNAINTGTTFGTLVSGVYTQLVVTRDTTTTRLYQNGSFLGSTTSTPNSSTTSLGFNANAFIGGTISNVLAYNKALSAAEILQNYNAQKFRFGLT